MMDAEFSCKREVLDEGTIKPLLSTITSRNSAAQQPVAIQQQWLFRNTFLFKYKATLIILMWNILVGGTYGTLMYVIFSIDVMNYITQSPSQFHIVLLGYGFVALVQLLCYPIGGLIADICCGRYRIVTFSIFKLICSLIFLTITSILSTVEKENEFKSIYVVFLTIAGILLTAGFTGFQSNSVQFGLDQLLDASSNELSLFLHWFVWTENLGQLFVRVLGSILVVSKNWKDIVLPFPIAFLLSLSVLLVLSCCKHRWFHSEPRTQNPYGTVYQVLKFVAKHDKPIRRSALTYCDDERPTRMEFAKQRFGGPFTTEMVEDVKTFLRILIMLVAIGPIQAAHVSATQIFPFFGLHMSNGCKPVDNEPNYIWVFLCSGNLAYFVTIVFFPLYILLVHPHIHKWMPRILTRLGVSMALLCAVTLSMTVTQVAAHLVDKNETVPCLFTASYLLSNYSQTYDIHPAILAIPSVLKGVASPLIYVTILEFISAQSPHTMKGLLLGVFYAIRGLFVLMGLVAIFPFSIPRFWPDSTERSSFFTCDFSYYLLACILGGLGMLIFLAAAKWYRYRQREDEPYTHAYVENYYYQRSIARDSEEEPTVAQAPMNCSILDYGTMDGI